MSETSKYDRVQVSIPMGIGFFVRIAKKVNLGFEVGFRKTFTDYLDDVSGQYPDIDQLELENPEAAQFSYRAPEITDQYMPNPEGTYRGSPKSKDLYFFGGVMLSVVLFDDLRKR